MTDMEGRRQEKYRSRTGEAGEDAACRFLMERGHTILERNWRNGHLEIDIISMDRDGIHFVEVKTRRPPMQAYPEESVTRTKQRRIAAAAARYLASGQDRFTGEMECQFDIISVVISDNGTDIEYFPAAYYPVFT